MTSKTPINLNNVSDSPSRMNALITAIGSSIDATTPPRLLPVKGRPFIKKMPGIVCPTIPQLKLFFRDWKFAPYFFNENLDYFEING